MEKGGEEGDVSKGFGDFGGERGLLRGEVAEAKEREEEAEEEDGDSALARPGAGATADIAAAVRAREQPLACGGTHYPAANIRAERRNSAAPVQETTGEDRGDRVVTAAPCLCARRAMGSDRCADGVERRAVAAVRVRSGCGAAVTTVSGDDCGEGVRVAVSSLSAVYA